MTEDEKYAAYREYYDRSMKSQLGWSRRGGPNAHLTNSQMSDLANLRAAIHIFLLEHEIPRVLPEQPDLPF